MFSDLHDYLGRPSEHEIEHNHHVGHERAVNDVAPPLPRLVGQLPEKREHQQAERGERRSEELEGVVGISDDAVQMEHLEDVEAGEHLEDVNEGSEQGGISLPSFELVDVRNVHDDLVGDDEQRREVLQRPNQVLVPVDWEVGVGDWVG